MSSAMTGLRLPVSFAFGLVMVGTLFSTLWWLTDKTFDVTNVTPVEIGFTRIERDETLETRREAKPEREAPQLVTELPPLQGPARDAVVPIPNTYPGPQVLQLDGGVPMGSDRDAVPLVRVEPVYPPREAARGTEGWVRVQFDIAASGAVTHVVAVESEPGTAFDKAAVDAVARWRYNPSIVNGQAVERVGMQTLIRFTLEDAQ